MSVGDAHTWCSGCGAGAWTKIKTWVDPPTPPEGWKPYHQPSGVIYCPTCVAEIESAPASRDQQEPTP